MTSIQSQLTALRFQLPQPISYLTLLGSQLASRRFQFPRGAWNLTSPQSQLTSYDFHLPNDLWKLTLTQSQLTSDHFHLQNCEWKSTSARSRLTLYCLHLSTRLYQKRIHDRDLDFSWLEEREVLHLSNRIWASHPAAIDFLRERRVPWHLGLVQRRIYCRGSCGKIH